MKPLVLNCKGSDDLNIEEKLQHFMDVSHNTATQKYESIINEYKTKLDNQFEEHCREAQAQAKIREQHAMDAICKEVRREISHEQLEQKRAMATNLNNLKEQLFTEVNTLLSDYKKTPAYSELLLSQLTSAKKTADGEQMQIYLDASDASLLDSLQQKTGLSLQISTVPILGGIRVVIPSRNILIDLSLQTKLNQAKEEFHIEYNA